MNEMNQAPQAEHQWLERLVGRWSVESECVIGPEQPPTKTSGTEVVRSLGGLWTISEGEGTTGEGAMRYVITLGYDARTKRFVGTFVASCMGHLWVYDGALDGAGKVLTLDAEGPSCSGDGLAKYQDVIELKAPDRRTLRSQMLGADGKWVQFMTTEYRRIG